MNLILIIGLRKHLNLIWYVSGYKFFQIIYHLKNESSFYKALFNKKI